MKENSPFIMTMVHIAQTLEQISVNEGCNICYEKGVSFQERSPSCFFFPPPSAPLSSACLSVWLSQVTESGSSQFSLPLSLPFSLFFSLIRLDMANPFTLPTPVQGCALVMPGWLKPTALVSEQTPGIPGYTQTQRHTHRHVNKKQTNTQTNQKKHLSCWHTLTS